MNSRDLALPEGMTAEELSKDKAFEKSVKESLADALGASVNAEAILILGIELAGQTKDATRRLQASGKLKVLYMITVEDETSLANVLKQLNDPEGAGFAAAFTKTLEKKAAANGFKGFKVKAMVAKPPTTEAKFIEVSTTPKIIFDETTAKPRTTTTTVASNESKTTTPRSAGGFARAPSPPTTTTSPKPVSPPPPLEGDNSGSIAGGVVGALCGILIVGGTLAYLKKKKKAKLLGARDPDAVVPFEGSSDDVATQGQGDLPVDPSDVDPAVPHSVDPVTPINAKPKSKGQKVKAACVGVFCFPCAKCARRASEVDASIVAHEIQDQVQNLSS